jgi:hypothetical protein
MNPFRLCAALQVYLACRSAVFGLLTAAALHITFLPRGIHHPTVSLAETANGRLALLPGWAGLRAGDLR